MSFACKGISLIFVSLVFSADMCDTCRRWTADSEMFIRYYLSTLSRRRNGTGKMLAAPVKPFGHLGKRLETLPSPFPELLGKQVAISKEALRRLLRERNVEESQLGGSLDQPLSRANNNDSHADFTIYFVIHDTSTPNFLDQPFRTTSIARHGSSTSFPSTKPLPMFLSIVGVFLLLKLTLIPLCVRPNSRRKSLG